MVKITEIKLTDLPDKVCTEVYGDLAQPALKEIGLALKETASALHFLTLPFSMLGLSAEVLLEKYNNFLIDTYKKVPANKLKSPEAYISSPIMENVKNVFDKDDIRNLYINLLANASNMDTYLDTHPAFVDIIKQFTSVEVIILDKLRSENFLPFIEVNLKDHENKLTYPHISPFALLEGLENSYQTVCSSIQNLERLGLIVKSSMVLANHTKVLQEIFNSDILKNYRDITQYLEERKLQLEYGSHEMTRGSFILTELGKKFISVCY